MDEFAQMQAFEEQVLALAAKHPRAAAIANSMNQLLGGALLGHWANGDDHVDPQALIDTLLSRADQRAIRAYIQAVAALSSEAVSRPEPVRFLAYTEAKQRAADLETERLLAEQATISRATAASMANFDKLLDAPAPDAAADADPKD